MRHPILQHQISRLNPRPIDIELLPLDANSQGTSILGNKRLPIHQIRQIPDWFARRFGDDDVTRYEFLLDRLPLELLRGRVPFEGLVGGDEDCDARGVVERLFGEGCVVLAAGDGGLGEEGGVGCCGVCGGGGFGEELGDCEEAGVVGRWELG